MTELPAVPTPWRLNATVIAAHDGDTFTVLVDWGKRRYENKQPIRIIGIAARELDDPGGPEAADALARRLPPGTPVVLATVKDDKYAPRWDCQVTYLRDGHPRDLATDLIADGWAVAWNGRGVQPKPPWPRAVA